MISRLLLAELGAIQSCFQGLHDLFADQTLVVDPDHRQTLYAGLVDPSGELFDLCIRVRMVALGVGTKIRPRGDLGIRMDLQNWLATKTADHLVDPGASAPG